MVPQTPRRPVLRAARGLALTTHPGPAVAVTALSALLSRAASLPLSRGSRVITAVGCGQLVIGWTNDLVDVQRDRAVERADKPLAKGDVSPVAVGSAATLAAVSCVVASLGCGRRSGLTHLGLVGCGVAYNLGLKSTWWSFAPYALAFGSLPSVATLAAPSPALAPWPTTAGAALLGVGAHLVNALPDLEDDEATGVAGLPHRLGERRTRQLVGAVLLGSTLVLLAGRRPLRRADLAPLAATLALVPPAVRTRGRSSLAAVVAIAGVDVALLGRGRPRKDPRR
ncbi:4-hydroxybenzoate polyprenyltransferase [Janibacter sp. UYMM211]